MHDAQGDEPPLIVERGWMRYLRGWWFLLWCAAALLLGLALGSVWRLR